MKLILGRPDQSTKQVPVIAEIKEKHTIIEGDAHKALTIIFMAYDKGVVR